MFDDVSENGSKTGKPSRRKRKRTSSKHSRTPLSCLAEHSVGKEALSDEKERGESRKGRTEVAIRLHPSRHSQPLLILHNRLPSSRQSFSHSPVFPQVAFERNEADLDPLAMGSKLFNPFRLDVLERDGLIDLRKEER
jgi:hypothetical protein